jgi:histidyl-tRNA synthetase
MKKANRSGAQFAMIIGENEITTSSVTIKDMESGEQSTAAFGEVVDRLDDLFDEVPADDPDEE